MFMNTDRQWRILEPLFGALEVFINFANARVVLEVA